MLQTDLQTMLLNLYVMHISTLKIEEDMEFQRGLSVKQFLEIFLSRQKLTLLSCILTFETISG
jgi:hypothetical protein